MTIDSKELRELNVFDASAIGYHGIVCGISVPEVRHTTDLNLFDASAIGYHGIVVMTSATDLIIQSSFNTSLF